MNAGKRYNLFVLNEDMNDVTKIVKSLDDLGVLIGGVTETVKQETQKQKDRFRVALLTTLTAFLVQPVISSVVKGLSGKGVTKEGRGCKNKIF